MDSIPEYVAFISNRESMYRLLGHLYKFEIDRALLDHMAGMRFPVECEDEDLAAGYRMMEEYLRQPGANPLADLAADYKKIFTGMGISKTEAAFPYESIYTSPVARAHLQSIFKAKGLENSNAQNLPEDHISIELEFMAYLCTEMQECLAAENLPWVSASTAEQKEFLVRHLLNWVPAFCAEVQKCAGTQFYKAVAKITSGFLRMEKAIVEDLIEEWDVKSE